VSRKRGFSLVELLIVVAIILVLAAIAIPRLLHAKMAANESSAAATVRTITAAETAYASVYPSLGYALKIQDLAGAAPCTPSPSTACILDDTTANAVPGTNGHSGYQFLATGINAGGPFNDAFVAGATPKDPGYSGAHDFCEMSDCVLRSQPSSGGTPPIAVSACLAYPSIQ
jgi:prepilin-type N-terminal cleavage/methylation domain-containing protein